MALRVQSCRNCTVSSSRNGLFLSHVSHRPLRVLRIHALNDDQPSRLEPEELPAVRTRTTATESKPATSPQAQATNLIQGAIEEAQLITWPKPKKAFFETILVLGIVVASGMLLFGVNVLLAEVSEYLYHAS